MNEKLFKILMMAKENPEIKEILLRTKNEKNPVSAFCRECGILGVNVTPDEIIAMGDDYCDTMIRSVNGGGVNAPYGDWNDMYDIFFAALEEI